MANGTKEIFRPKELKPLVEKDFDHYAHDFGEFGFFVRPMYAVGIANRTVEALLEENLKLKSRVEELETILDKMDL